MLKYLSRLLLYLVRHSRMKKLAELEKNEYRSKEFLENLQEDKFLALIKHAKSNVPYYRENLEGIKIESLEDIASIPFLTKKVILRNKNQLKAQNYTSDRFHTDSTGGSTGEKLQFYSDKNEIRAVFLMRGNKWAGWKVGEKQAQLWGAHYDISKAGGLYRKLQSSLIHRNKMMSSYDMTKEDMFDYCKIINKHKPRIITGYASALYLFSEFIQNNDLKIHKPAGIISSAETLHNHQREKIETVFGCKVLNRYGCREVGNIAQECEEQSGLHINIEHVIVEIVDENGKPCKPGQTGEIVITELDNYAFPFIRYKIGDLGVLSDRNCDCGRRLPMLENVKGRIFDIIVGTNGNHLTGTFWTILLREYVQGINKFQVIQEEYGKLLLRLIVTNQYNEKGKAKLIKKIKENCGEDMNIDIELVDKIPLTESGKHRFIISKVSPFVAHIQD
ncbi:MAG: AMP-binding protein [Candidatus Krumholzibacteriota bacterium]|nr:AMP-binding protein [Candidatus Krumholzibacteriota bacterium]